MKHTLTNADCLKHLERCSVPCGGRWDTIFADPPDNIGLGYNEYDDSLPVAEYRDRLREWLYAFINVANAVWFSYNSRWTTAVAGIAEEIVEHNGNYSARKAEEQFIEAKFCVQTFTFGQHNHHDLGNCHRPLLRLRWKEALLFPDAIRVESERQKIGDKRADPRGRVPGDVFDFPRVTGNSKQRRTWHKTQLHEGLVERCLRLTTPPDGYVLDPFGGTGTTLRVAKRCGFNCDLIELDSTYCANIAGEHDMKAQRTKPPTWTLEYAVAQPEDLPMFGGRHDTETLGAKSQS